MKKSIILLSLVCIVCLQIRLPAQDSTEEPAGDFNEIYITTYALSGSGFGMQYKTSMMDGQLLRIGVAGIHADYTKNKPAEDYLFDSKEFSFNISFEVGPEWRTPIHDRLIFFYGPSIAGYYRYEKEVEENPTLPEDMQKLKIHTIAPGLGVCAGMLVNIKNDFYFGVEVTPAIVFSYTVADNYTGNDIEKDKTYAGYLDLDNETIRVSLVYRWGK